MGQPIFTSYFCRGLGNKLNPLYPRSSLSSCYNQCSYSEYDNIPLQSLVNDYIKKGFQYLIENGQNMLIKYKIILNLRRKNIIEIETTLKAYYYLQFYILCLHCVFWKSFPCFQQQITKAFPNCKPLQKNACTHKMWQQHSKTIRLISTKKQKNLYVFANQIRKKQF